MIKILFIDALKYWDEGREFEALMDNPGLLYICGFLKQEFDEGSIEIKVIYKDVENVLIDFKPDVVGITSVTQNFQIAKEYAKLSKNAGCTVIMGGPHISALPEVLSEFMDIGVVGEGEETMVELMKLYEVNHNLGDVSAIHKIKGIVYRYNGENIQTEMRSQIKPLEKIPFPAREHAYIKRGLGIFTSRGCPYKCSFCFITQHWKTVRFFPPEYVVSEMKYLVEKYNAKHLTIFDDLFAQNKKRLKNIVALMKQENIPDYLTFNCNLRVDHVSDETASLLKEMGVRDVFLGVESGSQASLTYLKGGKNEKRNVTVEQNSIAIQILKKYGIRCMAGIIIGSPQETEEEILETYEWIKASQLDKFFVFVLTPLPGTSVWNHALEKGFVSNDMDWDKLRMEFGEVPEKAIVLSETISRDRLYELFKLIEKEKKKRDFIDYRRVVTRTILDVIKDPAFFFKKWLGIIARGDFYKITGFLSRNLKRSFSMFTEQYK